MLKFLLAIAAILLMADYSRAQPTELDPAQCEQLKQAVAQYGYAAARRHAMDTYGPEAVKAGDKCLDRPAWDKALQDKALDYQRDSRQHWRRRGAQLAWRF
jgi:hypothetical protein